jgi:L-arabinose isomerase
MESIVPKLGLVTLVSPFEVGADKAESLQKQAIEALARAGLRVASGGEPVQSDEEALHVARELISQESDAICILYATYADDTFATTIIEQSDLVAIIWGTNQFDSGSIAGAQQVSAILTEIGRYYKLVFGDINDARAVNEIVMSAKVAAAGKRIRNSRIGVIGYPRIKGQTQAAFDEVELRERFGCRVVGIGTHRFLDLIEKASDNEARLVWRRLSEGITKTSVGDDLAIRGAKAYVALKNLVQQYRLDAIALEDWNDFIGLPNLAFSLLNEEGVPAGCEADVHSTLTLYLLALLTGRPAFHGELLGILEQEDALIIAHYGAGAPSLATSKQDIRLEPDRSPLGQGVSVVFQFKPGPVTIASLTGRRGTYRMLVAPGESIRAREVFHGGIVANVRFRVNHREVLRKARGMSHHWMVAAGDVSKELSEFCEIAGIKAVVI